MSNNLKEIRLGREAQTYLRDSLGAGRQLSANLLRVVDFDSGTLRTFLPPTVSSEEANRFFVGGKLPPPEGHLLPSVGPNDAYRAVPIPNLDELLATLVLTHLESGDEAYCLFEDAMAKPEDPWLEHAEVRPSTSETSVYYLLTSGEGQRTVVAALTQAKSIYPPLIGAFARVGAGRGYRIRSRAISEAQLLEVAEETERVVVGAYDGEGFLIWSKIA